MEWQYFALDLTSLSGIRAALIDATIAKARAEFDDPEIDRQQVLELLLEHRIETLKRDGGLEKTQFSLFRGRPIEDGFVEVPRDRSLVNES